MCIGVVNVELESKSRLPIPLFSGSHCTTIHSLKYQKYLIELPRFKRIIKFEYEEITQSRKL